MVVKQKEQRATYVFTARESCPIASFPKLLQVEGRVASFAVSPQHLMIIRGEMENVGENKQKKKREQEMTVAVLKKKSRFQEIIQKEAKYGFKLDIRFFLMILSLFHS